ncbi:MAG TPA: PQQ-binding-like beta-propeller repeat protein [Acidimicrobiales bacterium]|nr:PQQ-binding-like beta-propeller repeat protein [Acidimicrobiales bacterium]
MSSHSPLTRLARAQARRVAIRRRRTLAAVVGLAVLIAVGALLATSVGGGSSPTSRASSASTSSTNARAGARTRTIAATESGLLPWTLAAPISRSVVLPGPGNALVILGGLTTSNVSTAGIYTLDTTSGKLAHVANLSGGLHDSSGAVMDGRDVTFGGGSATTVATVQGVPAPSAAAHAPGTIATATVTGALPQPRSDSSAVTVGSTTYIVGGFDGTNPDPAVLATTDGASFSTVASLPVPVRYGAVAAAGGLVYVFGGEAVTGANAGEPVDDIQAVNPSLHRASTIGHLPVPLEGAAAVTIGTQIYLAGGDSTVPQTQTTGLGTTQLGPAPSGANPGAGATSATATAATVPGRGAGRTSGVLLAQSTPGTSTVSTVWAFDPATDGVLTAGRLQVPVSHAGATVIGTRAWLVGGETDGTQVSTVQMLTPNPQFGSAGASGAGSPYFGMQLLIADRGNNRFLLLNPAMDITWTYPSATSPPDPYGFVFPDDAFFIDKGHAIISNQEQNETIVEIAYPSGKILWEYGHPNRSGTAPGYLHEPDDAYLLNDGHITVADADNCRIVIINHDGTVAGQIGTNGRCVHNPPTSMGSPNGDTPLADGNLLISEINGSWISEYTLQGKLVWTAHPPVSYPSDPQQLGPDLYLVADYAKPGAFIYMNRAGQVLYRYAAASGPGMLDHPSLAERLPSGVIMLNDDYANRMVAIDPTTGALVWQYGVTDAAGTSPGMLNTPDGFDLLTPDGSTPTHPTTG